jgi:hypothetical protein
LPSVYLAEVLQFEDFSGLFLCNHIGVTTNHAMVPTSMKSRLVSGETLPAAQSTALIKININANKETNINVLLIDHLFCFNWFLYYFAEDQVDNA